MATASITSNEGELPSASAVLEVSATNPQYNQPALQIRQASTSGGAASIRIDDPNPDIEFVELPRPGDPPAGPDNGRGKYEIAVQSDQLQINGRHPNPSDDPALKRFQTLLVFQREGLDVSGNETGGNVGFRTTSQFGSGRGVIAIANASRAPSGNPASGGILYVEGGALKFRGSNGTVTTIAPP